MSYALFQLASPAGEALPGRERVEADVVDVFDTGKKRIHETSVELGRPWVAANFC